MSYRSERAYALNESTGDMEKCYVFTHTDDIFTKEDESETLTTKLSNMNTNIDNNSKAIATKVDQTNFNTTNDNVNNVTTEVTNARTDSYGAIYASVKDHLVASEGLEKQNFKESYSDTNYTILNPTYTTGYYYSGSAYVASSGFKYSAPIAVSKNDVIKVRAMGYLSNIVIITSVTSSGTVLSNLVWSANSTYKTYMCVIPDGVTYISICATTSMEIVAMKYQYKPNYTETIDYANLSFISTTFTSGAYVGGSGSLVSQSGWQYSAPIKLNKGSFIKVRAMGYSSNVVIISECNSTGTIKKTAVFSTDSNYNDYPYFAEKDVYVLISGSNNTSYPIIIKKYDNTNVMKYVDDLEVDYSIMFQNLACIGDSLTEGDYGDGNGVRAYNYPYVVSQLTKLNVSNLGHCGLTTLQYWNSYASVTSYANYDLAIILLGTNGGFTDTLTADTSAKPYADTNTGAYCKIIEKIQSDNPKCKIFMCSLPYNTGLRTADNAILVKIADKYSLPYLNLYDEALLQPYLNKPYDGIHFGKLGYTRLAQKIIQLMNKAIKDNATNYSTL